MSEDPNRLTRRKIPSTLLAIERSKFPAWLMSLCLHTVVILTLAVLWTPAPRGTGGERGGPVGIAIVVDNAGADSYILSGEQDSAEGSSSSAASSAALASLPGTTGSGEALASELKGLLPSTDGAGSGVAAGDVGLGSGNSQLPNNGRGAGSKVKTNVFGIEGEGTRFLYVFDRSASMLGFEEKPIKRAKEELINSLESLGETHQFQIVFYNDHPTPFGGSQRPKMLRGEDQQKEQAIRFVKNITGDGGTNHVDALNMALAMNPDVIFFLTDADDNPGAQKIERITNRADQIGATIHCIQFGEGNPSFGSNWIQRLAEQTRGKFKYIDVKQL